MLFEKMVTEPVFELEGFGVLKLISDKNGSEWFGNVQNISKNNTVELSIEVESNSFPSPNQIAFAKRFAQHIEVTEQIIYDYIYKSFNETEWQMTKESLKRMYYLSALMLKRHSEDVWITLEPHADVPTIFNHFLRFTLRNNEIVWSNLA
jgi:hypothetical protein